MNLGNVLEISSCNLSYLSQKSYKKTQNNNVARLKETEIWVFVEVYIGTLGEVLS